MTPRLRKAILTSHITFSVGWIGAVAAFLALSVLGMTSENSETIRGNYIAMDAISRLIVIPMSFAAIATGLLQALGSQWGLFRYYWIATKFLLAIFATAALLIHQFAAVGPAARRSGGAGVHAVFSGDFQSLQIELLRAPALAMLVLLTAVTLAVYKPWGLTRHGHRKQQATRRTTAQPLPEKQSPRGIKIFIAFVVALVLIFIVVHLTGHGFGRHGS